MYRSGSLVWGSGRMSPLMMQKTVCNLLEMAPVDWTVLAEKRKKPNTARGILEPPTSLASTTVV